MIYIISIILSIILFLVFKIKNIFKIRSWKLNIILSISFSTLFFIAFLIFSFVEIYILGSKSMEFDINSGIIVDNYKIFDSEIIIQILRRGVYIFVFNIIILLIIFFIIDFILFIINKLKHRQTSA